MTRIAKIERLMHPGVLRDFAWPADLPTFGRFNLIYGWNGSGKTTLSRVFRALEQGAVYSPGPVTLLIDGREVTEKDFEKATVPIRVFNRDFVDENVFQVTEGELPPIFVVGKESVEQQKEADRQKRVRTEKEARLQQARSTHNDSGYKLNQHCSDRAKVIKETLRVSGSGRYNNYDKTDYRSAAEKMGADGAATSHLLSDEQRGGLWAQHHATPKPRLQEATYRLPSLEDLVKQTSTLLEKTVVSSAIQTLKDDPALADWVHTGLGLHKEKGSATCLFCEQALPTDRLSSLEAHFNAEYEEFLRRIDEQIGHLKDADSAAAHAVFPDPAALYDDLRSDYESAKADLQSGITTVRKYLEELVRDLKRKKSEPFTALSLTEDVPALDTAAVERLNNTIRSHNTACDEFDSRVNTARERLALDMIAQKLDEFKSLRDATQAADKAIDQLEQEMEDLTKHIERIERKIRDHRQPAEELNDDLKRYLGHDELQLAIKDNGYSITRNGETAHSLSEGEMTAIAILYFLKSLEGRTFDRKNGVVVLDDPVSSLDANALYLAFGFIRYRTQDAGQLFVLTHNFAFFRLVRNWFYHQKGQNKSDVIQRPARFYMLDRVHGSSPRSTTLCALDRLLEEYESEYHYLFACVHRSANATSETGLEQNYWLPNVARRLLEMFLAFRRPRIAGELWQKLNDVAFDEEKKVRIARFVHTHSHGHTVGEPEHDPSLLGEARAVLADLLELIKSEDAQHYTAMVGLFSDPVAEVDSVCLPSPNLP